MSLAPPFRTLLRPGLALAAIVALLCCLIGPSPLAMAATSTPPVPSGLPAGIERLAAYVPANSCGSATRAGTVKLGNLLTSTYPGTSFGGIRACGTVPDSEHYDGRAVDWMNSIRSAKQAAQAKAVIGWLFATDNQGHDYANARRLGVMYVIWNNKIWGAYSADRGWRVTAVAPTIRNEVGTPPATATTCTSRSPGPERRATHRSGPTRSPPRTTGAAGSPT